MWAWISESVFSAATCPDVQLTFRTAQLSTSEPRMSQRVKTCSWLVKLVSDFLTDVIGSLKLS